MLLIFPFCERVFLYPNFRPFFLGYVFAVGPLLGLCPPPLLQPL